jgi:nucleoid-associated protein YgaU
MTKQLTIATALFAGSSLLTLIAFSAGGSDARAAESQPISDGFTGMEPLPGGTPATPNLFDDRLPNIDPVYPVVSSEPAPYVTSGTPIPADDLFGAMPTTPPLVLEPAAENPVTGLSPEPSTAQAATVATTHTVAKGETLGDISATHYGTSRAWSRIVAANPGLDPARLKVGQILQIPAGDAADTNSSAGSDRAAGSTYTVREGDSYYAIATAALGNAGRWREIEALNNIAAEALRPGMVIKLPSKAYGKVKGSDTWVVRPGDSLGLISQQHYGTTQAWQEIAQANPGINPEQLVVGTRLVLPAVTPGNVHVVQKGDTLGEISAQHYGTSRKWQDIVEANPGLDPSHLVVGQKLIIPGKTKNAAAAASSSAAASAGDYVVAEGDTLGAIASKTLGSSTRWEAIAAANPGIDPGNLRIGQRLVIPGGAGAGTAADPSDPSLPPALGTSPEQPALPEIVIPPEDLFAPMPVLEQG